MGKHNINIQDGFLFQNLKEAQTMFVELVTGRNLMGQLKRFDRFAVVIEQKGKEILVYKHAIATIATASSDQLAAERGTERSAASENAAEAGSA